MTKHVGLIGHPLGHSVSPPMQQAAFDHCKLDIRYETWDTDPTQLREVLARLRQASALGANVTVPYKEVMVPVLDRLDGQALEINAVNTIVKESAGLTGYNTDVDGFLEALRREGSFEPQGKRVVLLGAGGAARGISFGLARAGVSALVILNRTFERTEDLILDLKRFNLDLKALPWGTDAMQRALPDCDLVVNCTSMGMKHSPTESQSPLEAALIPKNALVYDVVYNPVETPLLAEAKKAGARTLAGLAMLVYQGALAFKLWTGEEAPIDIMFEAARQAL
jgi:shikimate dehydrogenase